MEKECPVEMIDYFAELSHFDWPEGAAYCRQFDCGAQFFSEDGKECGYVPFFGLVFVSEDTLTKREVLTAQLARANDFIESIKLELEGEK